MAPHAAARKRLAIDRQQLLILLVAAVMVGSFFLLILWPKQRELATLGAKVSRQRDVVNQKVRTSHDGLYVSAQISGLRRMQDYMGRRLPEEPHLAEFLQAVAERVQAAPGVTHEIQRTEARTGRAPAVPVCLRLTGSFEDVHRCLAEIEGLERLSRVRHVHFKRLDDTGKVAVEAEILAYYLPPEAPAAAPDRSLPNTRLGRGVVRG